MKIRTIATWLLRVIAAVIMLQTLYYKFTGSEESVHIFSTLGIEPWGRLATGALELIASILLLIPATTLIGALLGVGLMSGAIASHLIFLGIEVQNDNGLLFAYALTVFFCCLTLIVMKRRELRELLNRRK